MVRAHEYAICLLAIAAATLSDRVAIAEDPVFSGPQVGEKLQAFKAVHVRGSEAGEEFDFVGESGDKPSVIIFWHALERPAFGLIQSVLKYTLTRTDSELRTALVLLSNDREAPKFRGAIQRLPEKLILGVSSDGQEGPGQYGLNRHVKVTILVAKDGQVTDNFALVQPSVQVDGPKILAAIAKTIGEDPPSIEDFQNGMRGARSANMANRGAADARRTTQDEKLSGLLRAMIAKDATEEQVSKQVTAIEDYVRTKDAALKDLLTRSKRISESGKLENYGTKAAQAAIQRWAKEGIKSDSDPKSDKPQGDAVDDRETPH